MKTFLDGRVTLHGGDCLEVVRGLADNSIDSVVTDPPYALVSITKRFGSEANYDGRSNMESKADAQPPNRGAQYKRLSRGFMGKQWDTGETAFAVDFWAEVIRVLKPGGHVAAFGGTRSYHRLACAIEDAGFEIRDCLMWIYGTGFPKSHDVSKGIDKAAGHWRGRAGEITIAEQSSKGTEYERTDKGEPITEDAIKWSGWGTALKPAVEPIVLARKPLSERTVALNCLRWGTGAINVDGCRVEATDKEPTKKSFNPDARHEGYARPWMDGKPVEVRHDTLGRFPANLCHDSSDEVLAAFPRETGKSSGGGMKDLRKGKLFLGETNPNITDSCGYGDSGSAARFFYSAKASKADRALSKHPTVKPVKLMQWLVRLITPPNGTTLDPFSGTGTTGEAAWREGFSAVLIEREEEYQADIERRMLFARAKEKPAAKPRKRDCDPGTLELPFTEFDPDVAYQTTMAAETVRGRSVTSFQTRAERPGRSGRGW